MTNTTELIKKKPSKNLREAIHDMIGSFQKTATSIERVFSIGKNEGFSDMEIGNLIRKEMLAANYDPRTIRRALPPSAKHVEKVREQNAFADKMSANEYKNEVRVQSALESDHDITVGTINRVRDIEFEPNIPDQSIREPHQESGTEEDNTIFGLARISTLPEDSELLKLEIPIPRDIFWRYVEDHLGEVHDNQFWINSIMNQETGKILSLAFGRSGVP
jgi:hypothetical protein